MRKLISGSTAIVHHLGDEKYWRDSPADLDVITYSVDNDSLVGYQEILPNFLFTNRKERKELFLADLCPAFQYILKNNRDDTYVDLNHLLLIKNAHKHFYRGFFTKSFKHLLDYSNLLKVTSLSNKEKQVSEDYRNWLIEFAYNNDPRLIKVPSLNKSKESFFTDKVEYFVDHDLIHERVAINSAPAYQKCLTGEVMFSNKLFNQLDYQSKVEMVLEESFVLALERCLIPFMKGRTYLPAKNPSDAFKYALVRVATNITSGDFRDFAADNFADIFYQFSRKHLNYYSVIKGLL